MLWLEDSSILYQIEELRYFVPSSRMTWQQQANALVRFTVYLSFILYLYYGNIMVLLLPPALVMLVQLFLHQESKLEHYLNKFFGSELRETFILRADDYLEQANQKHLNQLLQRELTPSLEREGRILDAENNPTLAEARELGRESRHPQAIPLTSQRQNNQAEQRQRQVLAEVQQTPKPEIGLEYQEPAFRPKNIRCKKSTEANPFGNSLPWQSHEQDVHPICPDEYKKDENFYRNLFDNVNDVWNRNNGQLIFNSNPSTTRINDREAFMQFLFNTPYSEY